MGGRAVVGTRVKVASGALGRGVAGHGPPRGIFLAARRETARVPSTSFEGKVRSQQENRLVPR